MLYNAHFSILNDLPTAPNRGRICELSGQCVKVNLMILLVVINLLTMTLEITA